MSVWEYFQVEFVPIMTLLIIYYLSVKQFQGAKENKRFRVLVLLVIGVMIADEIAWYMLLNPGAYSIEALYFFNMAYFLLTESIAYFWFLNVCHRIYEEATPDFHTRMTIYGSIPAVLICIIIVLSPWNHMVFYIQPTDMTYQRGAFHLLQVGCGFGYMFLSSILAFIQSKKVQLSEQKREYRFLGYIVL